MKTTKTIYLFFLLSLFLSVKSSYAQSDPFLGEIRMFAGNFAPRGWEFCDGQLIAINSNSALFSLLGTMYGGDGRTTFALPDLRGRVAISAGRHPGSNTDYRQGPGAGSETFQLTTLNLPAHNHTATVAITPNVTSTTEAVRDTPITGDVPAAANFGPGLSTTKVKSFGPASNTVTGQTQTATVNINNTGNSQPISILQPYTVIRYIIATQGFFPSRR